MRFAALAGLALVLTPAMAAAATASPLFARGFTVMPEPQEVKLASVNFAFGSNWHLELGANVRPDSSALESLRSGLQERAGITLASGNAAGPVLALESGAGLVVPGGSQDRDREAIAAQAYRLDLAPSGIRIVANAEAGLFYGVQTFLQLLKHSGGLWTLPKGEITDWPDLQLRQIYWDDAHHLERLGELKRAVRQAAFFKINGFVVKLEGHFQFRSAAALVEPQALSPEQLQELTDYGLRYHVQVIPYLDAPGHIAFILKHREYAKLRAFAGSNYEMCVTNPDALKLMYGMYDDLMAANRGVGYFYLSTDEAYYVGQSNESGCLEGQRAKELGSAGRVLTEFVSEAANYLHERGRTVVFWGEYPLKPADIASLPAHVINGETYGEAYDKLYRAQGIRQMIYGSTEGEELLFPHYYLQPPGRRLHPLYEDYERTPASLAQIAADPARQNADLMGLVIAGWGDMGLHPETFWLGYTTIAAAGWKAWSAGAREAAATFYPLFYGPSATSMDRIYQLLSYQAQVFTDSWETKDSEARTPIWGNSERIFRPPKPARDQTLDLPAVPPPDLLYAGDWLGKHQALVHLAENALAENDELQGLLRANLPTAERNSYNLRVFLSLAQLCRQNLEMILSLKGADDALKKAGGLARAGKNREALGAIDEALAAVRAMRVARNQALKDATETWYESWLPRVPEANGRRFLHLVDDVKDHLPDRTVDMTYLVYRELQLPLESWYAGVEAARNRFAKAHELALRRAPLGWQDTE